MTGVDPNIRTTVSIDPFAPGPPGQYCDQFVGVVRDDDPGHRVHLGYSPVACTEHFCVRKRARRIEVSHKLSAAQLDNDIAGMLSDELFSPGWLSGAHIFERVFTGVIRSTVHDPLVAWDTFYRNTLIRVRQQWERPEPAPSRRNHSSIDGFAPVYRRAMALVPAGSVLDLGSCFGFLPLLLAARPINSVTASDISAGAMDLLDAMARQRKLAVRTLVCDAAQVPLPDRAVDTVTLIHLMEHLDPITGSQTLAEAVRLARRRVVVAVPFEKEPNPAFGHVRTFTPELLAQTGRLTGCRFAVTDYHGGWLVINTG